MGAEGEKGDWVSCLRSAFGCVYVSGEGCSPFKYVVGTDMRDSCM